MEKSIACRWEACLRLVIGVVVLMVHAGCLNGSGVGSGGSAGRHDSGACDGKAVAVDGGADTRRDLLTVDSRGTGTGGAATGGSGGTAGAGGTGGTISPGTRFNDAAIVDAPQPSPAGGTGGAAGSGSGGSAGSGGGAGGVSSTAGSRGGSGGARRAGLLLGERMAREEACDR